MANLEDTIVGAVPQEEDNDENVFLDLAAAPFRGAEGAVQGVYNLADYIAFDTLPDYDTKFLGTSKTLPGQAVEGISQFLVGFGPIFGVAGKVGALAKASKVQKALVASAVTDFTVFNGQEARLSNFIEQFPELQNPITEFLAHDDEEGEIEGRLKNVLEGLGLEAVGGVFVRSLKAFRNAKKVKNKTNNAPETYRAFTEEMGGSIAYADMPSFTDEARVLQKELDQDKTRLDELLKKKEEGKATGADETRISMLENRIEGKEADLRVLGDVRTADVRDRVRAAEERELQERVEELDETLEDFDATVERTPRPFKTYEEEAMMDIIPKGADTLKSRLMKKFPIKGADPQDVADVEKFVDVMGKRLFGDVALSITNKIPSAGRYNFGNNLLQIRQSVIDEGGIKRTMVHELWHGLSRYLPKTDVTALTKQFDKARRDYIRSFGVELDDTVDPSSLLKRTIPKELERFLKGKHTSKNYRFKDVDEYFAEEMTDAFLKKLDEKDLAPTGTLKRIAQEVAIMFKDMFASLKAKLGIDQRQKIFNDFLKQRNVTKRAEAPLDMSGRLFADLPEFKKGKTDEFLQGIPEYFRGYVGALLKGQSITMPRFRTDTDGYVLKEILERVAATNPDFVEQYTKDWKDGDTFKTGDEVVDNSFQAASANLDPIEATRQARQLQAVWRVEGKGLIERVLAARDEVKETQFGEAASANLKNVFQEFVEYADRYRRLGKEASLLLGERRENLSRFRGSDKKVGLDEAEILTDGTRRSYLGETGDWSRKAKELVEILEYVDPDDLDGAIRTVTDLSKKSQGKHWLDMPLEYWMNSILSGSAQIVNAVGAAFTGTMHTLETAVGGLITGHPQIAKEAIAGWADFASVREGFHFYVQALKNDRSYFNTTNKYDLKEPAITPERFGIRSQRASHVRDFQIEEGVEPISETSKAYKAIDIIGKIIRLPTRHLQAQDTFFKTVFARRELRLRLGLDAMKQIEEGVPKEIVAERLQKNLKDLIDQNGKTFSEETLIREGLSAADAKGLKDKERVKYALEYKQQQIQTSDTYNKLKSLGVADHLTMMEELKPGLAKDLQQLTQRTPFLKVFLPFVRTPTNILNYAIGRTPLGAQFRKDISITLRDVKQRLKGGALDAEYEDLTKALENSDPLVVARAHGRLATSTAAVAVLTEAVMSNREFITGGGPSDEKQIKSLKATGWRPYSIKIGDTYYSYVKLDPYATLLGTIADFIEVGVKEPAGFDESSMQHLGSALITSVQRNIVNKSYLKGLDSIIKVAENPEVYGDYFLESFAGSLVPFSSALTRLQEFQGDQISREIHSMSQALLYRLPGGRSKLDPKRNLLGEAFTTENIPLVGVINPIAYSTEKNDPVLTEMANLKHSFRQPPSKMEQGLVELLNYTNKQGQSSYDRWLELTGTLKLGGKTLKQSLAKMITTSSYNRLPDTDLEIGLDSPKVQLFNRVINKYRARAFNQVLRESHTDEQGIELSDYYGRAKKAKLGSRRGMQREDVLALLTQ